MTSSQFLESLSNISKGDYMQRQKERHPAFFLRRVQWLAKRIPDLFTFICHTKFIHITGTSGKGTVGAMIQSILSHAGYKVGFYNSPYVEEFYERMIIWKGSDRHYIPPQTFENLIEFIKPYLEKAILRSPYGLSSYFEILVTIALLYFKHEKCDYVVLEVGCGGRYDATNIIPKSELSIITSIGYDHEHLIGPTLSDIAYEKAGIIKKGGRVLIGPGIKLRLRKVIEKEILTKHARSFYCSNDSDFHKRSTNNETIAVRAAEILNIQPEAIQQGLSNYIPLPCRLEIIQKNPLVIFDGAHNPDKVRYLISQLNNFQISQYRRRFLIFASVDTKRWRQMLKLLAANFTTIYLTRHTVIMRKSADLKELHQYVVKLGKKARIFIDPNDALKDALKQAKKDDLIVATGSLFLVGGLKNFIQSYYALHSRH